VQAPAIPAFTRDPGAFAYPAGRRGHAAVTSYLGGKCEDPGDQYARAIPEATVDSERASGFNSSPAFDASVVHDVSVSRKQARNPVSEADFLC
jgi:hypothetical protein